MIDDIFEEPGWDEIAVEQRMDSNQSIFLLDCSEDNLIARTCLPFAAPDDVVGLQPVAKVPGVELVEDRAQIEKAALLNE
jgi:hypothetical protein